jgi:hypothetical protein
VIAGDDPAPWKLLADGTIVGIDRFDDVVWVLVEVRASRVKVLLAGCDAVRYQPHDEPMLYELDAIAASQPDIRDAVVEKSSIVVTGGAGTLRLTYANLAIEIDEVRIELDELARRLR